MHLGLYREDVSGEVGGVTGKRWQRWSYTISSPSSSKEVTLP